MRRLCVVHLDTPIPFNKTLEKQYMANDRLEEMMAKLLNY